MERRFEAILLLGPTGSGKTPLGQVFEARGVAGRACAHFDFGENLRQIVARDQPDEIVTREDIDFLRDVLRSGALLEDKDFPIAERILRRFLSRPGMAAGTLIVLNGLPRHVGQAQSVARILDVRTVLFLECSAETVVARVTANTGGDRTGRTDDDLAAIRRKLAIFAERTEPLLEFFRTEGAQLVHRVMTVDMTAEMLWETLVAEL
jgi:adenylate kinase family enzyme